MSGFMTVRDLVAWLKEAPRGTQIDAATVLKVLEDAVAGEPLEEPKLTVEASGGWTWAERI